MDISMEPGVVHADVAVPEEVTEQETHHQKDEANRRNRQKNRESRDSNHKRAPDLRETTDELLRGSDGRKGMPDSRTRRLRSQVERTPVPYGRDPVKLDLGSFESLVLRKDRRHCTCPQRPSSSRRSAS